MGAATGTIRGPVMLLLLASLAGAQSAPPFGGPLTYAAGTTPTGIVLRDVNRDGKPDAIVANESIDKVSVALGAGDGSFGAATSFSVGDFPQSVGVADFDLDGKPDLAVANAFSNTVSVLRGSGNGSFVGATNFATGTQPMMVAAGDLDGDGNADLATANMAGNNASVLVNQWTSGGPPMTFAAAANFGTGSGPRALTLCDVDRDGQLDLVTANLFGDSVSVLVNQTPYSGVPSFTAAVNYVVSPAPYVVAAADLSGDGRPDLATTGLLGVVSVLLGQQPEGSFATRTNFAVGSQPKSLAIGDLNRDGRPDLVALNFNSLSASLLMGQGGGVHCPAENLPLGPAPTTVAVADLNADGRPDVVATNTAAGTITVRLNQLPASGPLGFLPPTSLAAGSNPVDLVSGDLDGDGRLDLASACTSSQKLSVGFGNGEGGFVSSVHYTVGDPRMLAVGDVDSDGDLDVAVANQYNSAITLMLNTGGGALVGGGHHSAGATPEAITAADVNLDGLVDIVAGDKSTYQMRVLYNAGGGTYGWPPVYLQAGFPFAFATGDIDRDGDIDVAAALFLGAAVAVYPGTHLGVLGSPSSFAVGTEPDGVAARDLDGDGDLDLVAVNFGDDTVSVLRNQTSLGGAFAFAAAVHYAVGDKPQPLAVGDLDGDGRPDLAVPNVGSGTVSILRGQGAATFAAATSANVGAGPDTAVMGDFNADGRLDLAASNYNPPAMSVALSQGPLASQWTGLLYALAGSSGLPSLCGLGTLVPATTGSLVLGNTVASAPASLFVSFSSAPAAFKGGLLAAFPFTLNIPLVTDPSGGLPLPFTWPPGLPSGTKMWFQFAVQDAAAMKGVALSNALLGVTP